MSDRPQRLSEEHMGYRVDLSREQCLGGWEMTYYSVFRLSDGWEATSGYTEEETPLPVMMAGWKGRIEAELREADPWDEEKEKF